MHGAAGRKFFTEENGVPISGGAVVYRVSNSPSVGLLRAILYVSCRNQIQVVFVSYCGMAPLFELG